MKKVLLVVVLFLFQVAVNAQCTTTNATGCHCKDSTQTDCDLLPDIEIGHPPFYDYTTNFGILEYSQTGNGADNGRLKVTVSTPNTGFGPLELRASNIFVCGTDTFVGTAPSICPDLVSFPKILINQRIYHKSGTTMTYYDRPAGTMTYHPSHGHMHVDNWGNYTLRVRDSLQPNPLLWPIIGTGTKLAFCVEDYGTCSDYPDHCLDSNGVSLNNPTDFPNYGLGGGGYSCSPVYQGISSGYVDVYWTDLDGMWINLPPGICNGIYYIVCEVDPNNNFVEEHEDNNVYAVPFTLTKQADSLSQMPLVIANSMSTTELCQGESVTLTVSNPMPNLTYMWSNGDQTKSTTVSTAGTYTVTVNSQCGSATSAPITITTLSAPPSPSVSNDTIPGPGSAILTGSSVYPISWFDQITGDTALYTGSTFNTPFITNTTTFYAQTSENHPGAAYVTGLPDSAAAGTGGYYNGDQSMIFDCINTMVLQEVTIYAATSGSMNVQLKTSAGTLLQSVPVTYTAGMNILTLNMTIPPGQGYYLTRDSGNLYRNNPGVSAGYPLNVAGVCSITSSTAGDNYYYFFYNWQVKLPDHICTSPRVPVEAMVLNPNSIADVNVLNSLIIYPNPAHNSVRVTFRSAEKNVAVSILDAIGKTAGTYNISSSAGIYDQVIDVSGFAHGVYNLHILSDGKNTYRRFVVD
jgi:hypothetical protein